MEEPEIKKDDTEQEKRSIILGAFGCGVFQNDPVRVVNLWKKLLIDEQWRNHFDEILFVVYDHSAIRKTIQALEQLKENT